MGRGGEEGTGVWANFTSWQTYLSTPILIQLKVTYNFVYCCRHSPLIVYKTESFLTMFVYNQNVLSFAVNVVIKWTKVQTVNTSRKI